ncbi:MAG: 1-acyl-sn-glycerol-3-phosphate acyltransferase [Gracilimonas sp.]|nr:1-acyl-sn-glycerol-3-phosphate acyltransferase [Gracilimonas sp.]
MKFLRATIKLISFLLVTLFLYSLIMASLIGAIIGVNYEKIRGYLLRFWGRCICKIIGIKLEVKGKIPNPPFLLVSNHLSYIDVFVLFSQLRCLFVAKSDVKTWPLMGFIIRTCGILFIDRNRKRDITRVNKLISKNINENQGIILFPEGTTSPGMEVLPFRTPLLEYPATEDLSVSYVAISYESKKKEQPAYESICWWDDASFFSHFMNVLKMKGFKAKLHFGETPVKENDRKLLAEKLHSAVKNNFKPVVTKEAFNAKHDVFKPLSF